MTISGIAVAYGIASTPIDNNLYQLKLVSCKNNFSAAKLIRSRTYWDINVCFASVKNPPCLVHNISENFEKFEADRIIQDFADIGAKVEMYKV